MNKFELRNKVSVIMKSNENTPRIALTLNLSIDGDCEYSCNLSVLNRLFFQGTQTRSAHQIAQILDENAIECYSSVKSDSVKFQLQCLNEDFELALDILQDIIFKIDFSNFEKECNKLRGEIKAHLDSPKNIAFDGFYRNIFKGHRYGNTSSVLLDMLDSISLDSVKSAYSRLIGDSFKVISVVGDIERDRLENLLEEKLGRLESKVLDRLEGKGEDNLFKSKRKSIIKIEKDNVAQSQIIMGWKVPSFDSCDFAALSILNTILGSSGLSSRLFLELRDKKGLAYVVRSNYEPHIKGAIFSVYIATNPENIETSLKGFEEEIIKLNRGFLSKEELESAKSNYIGKKSFFQETNMQQSNYLNFWEFVGLGYDYEFKLIEAIERVSKEDVENMSKKYLDENFTLTILGNRERLESLGEINLLKRVE